MLQRWSTTVCIAGGGPAGMMLGLLLARAGIEVTVLEKHADFFRDFRGDTIHPSTLDLLDQLGLSDRLEAIPHTAVATLDAVIRGVSVTPVDFATLRGGANRLVFMPQWDLLDLLATAARELPTFRLVMGAEVTGLSRDGARVSGVRALVDDPGTHGRQEVELDATLTVAADGRGSVLRDASGARVIDGGVPIDVLWFRLPRPKVSPPDAFAYVTEDHMAIAIPRTDYFQVAFLITKGAYGETQTAGLPAFRQAVAKVVPFLESSVDAITGWDDVKLLSVQINRLQRWHQPGLLCIGDAAHAMSPAFGVGINYALQDAVAAANLLVEPLRAGTLTDADLARVQRRREWPVRLMQALQRQVHRAIGRPGSGATLPSPAMIRGAARIVEPFLQPLMARAIGRGFRPERIGGHVLR